MATKPCDESKDLAYHANIDIDYCKKIIEKKGTTVQKEFSVLILDFTEE